MPTNFTEDYQLSQWVKSDQVKMEDFNTDNAKIDAAIKAEADARTVATAALAAEVAKRGNCRIECHSYVGTGEYGPSAPTVLTFSKPPLLFIVKGPNSLAFGSKLSNYILISYTIATSAHHTLLQTDVTWSGNQVSFLGSSTLAQLNENNPYVPYLVFAFYPADEA